MTDALDRLVPAARPLLHRVDAALAETGAAPDDPVWPLLRRVRALPSDAVAAVAGWRPEPPADAAASLRTLARGYVAALDGVPAHPPWEGAGAVAYGVQWSALRGHVLGAGPASMVGRVRETAEYLDEMAEWIRRSRRAVAMAVADALESAEAVILVTGSPLATSAVGGRPPAGPQPDGAAAARIAVHVLEPVATACDEGQRLHDDWHSRLGEVPLQVPSAASSAAPGGAVRIGD